MADRENELVADRENAALKKLQGFAGVGERTRERVDWMYEQSVAQKTDEELMNEPVGGQANKDMEDVKALGTSATGSLFLKGPATRTTEDVLRKLREDPLFQIRREEQAARQSMMQNPLIQARLKKKMEKASKKDKKKAKKAAKKEKKAMKKAKKANKKASKKSSSSSSSGSSSGSAATGNPAAQVAARALAAARERAGRGRSRSASREGLKKEEREIKKEEKLDLAALGPKADLVDKREERAARIAEGKRQALDSRGAPRRMDEDEKKRRYDEMVNDAKSHDAMKTRRISEAERKEKEQVELEEKMREKSGKSKKDVFSKIREEAYMESNANVADRLKNQRHRRQKGVVDSLEKD